MSYTCLCLPSRSTSLFLRQGLHVLAGVYRFVYRMSRIIDIAVQFIDAGGVFRVNESFFYGAALFKLIISTKKGLFHPAIDCLFLCVLAGSQKVADELW